MYKILTLNNISVAGLEHLPRDQYEVASEIQHPDAILLRSFNMHDMDIPASVKAIGRAGAGVNNIPVDKMSQRGVPVFNAPGANANAVKELVMAGYVAALGLTGCREEAPRLAPEEGQAVDAAVADRLDGGLHLQLVDRPLSRTFHLPRSLASFEFGFSYCIQ